VDIVQGVVVGIVVGVVDIVAAVILAVIVVLVGQVILLGMVHVLRITAHAVIAVHTLAIQAQEAIPPLSTIIQVAMALGSVVVASFLGCWVALWAHQWLNIPL
jgi:hypothetical protein